MKERKIKLIIVPIVIALVTASIMTSLKKSKEMEFEGDPQLKKLMTKKINDLVSTDCDKFYSSIRLNESKTYAKLEIGTLLLRGSAFSLKSVDNLVLREINLENVENSIKLKAFIFDFKQLNKCLGVVL